MKVDFTGKVAVVTGTGGGIGRAICLKFAKVGAKVVSVDVNEELGSESVDLVTQAGGEAIYIRADVTSSADVENYVKQTIASFGRIDAFANNAGWEGVVQPTVDYPEDIFDKVMAVNVKGVFLGLKYVLPEMLRRKSGAVVNTASTAGWKGAQGMVAYIASKNAVIGITKTAALEVARQGGRVNAVCPGPTNTRMIRSIESGVSPDNPEAVLKAAEASIPDGRYGEAYEVARR